MGRMQRVKGKVFERLIAGKLREQWSNVVVRRASQAERADNPDVFSEGHPVLDRMWLELQDARRPTPEVKLDQAERDIVEHLERRPQAKPRIPIVVWHQLGERSIQTSTRLWVLGELAGWLAPSDQRLRAFVTIDFSDFISLVDRCARRGGL